MSLGSLGGKKTKMKTLFIHKSNPTQCSEIIIRNQARSLQEIGVEVEFFGVSSYFKDVFRLRKILKKSNYTVIHAHYGLLAMIAVLAAPKRCKVVVTLMGMDIIGVKKGSFIQKVKGFLVVFISRSASLFASYTILKSPEMAGKIWAKKYDVIPNGVDIDKFKPFDRDSARQYLNLPTDKPIILFAASPKRTEKNFKLFKNAIQKIGFPKEQVLVLENIKNSEIPYYLNATDIIILTSTQEGSPNVIKEAMACNRPIIATPVGDIPQLLKNVQGSTILPDFSPESLANAIKSQLNSQIASNGRDKIFEMKLDSESVARRIEEVYKSVSQKSL